MSTPSSRLATFRSYSYYHVLVMCDCSQTADELSSSTAVDVWEHAADDVVLGPYGIKTTESGGQYIVLINGSTDATYTIEHASWLSSTGASAVPGDRSTSIAVEGQIRISEPKGVAFLDQIVQCTISLGVDSSQIVYALKTFFVGENQFQTGEQDDYADVISDTPPITFVVYNVEGEFTEGGGTYHMEFVAAGHGATRMPQYSKAVNAMSVTAGDSLADTMSVLQDNINASYQKYFDCVYSQIASLSGDTKDLLASLTKVTYVIVVGEDYQDTDGIKYAVTNQSAQYKNTSGCKDPAQVTFPPHTSIETAINTILEMCPQVQADMTVGDASTKVKYEPKIHTALVSARGDDGNITYTVYYRVERFATPSNIAFQDQQVLQNNNPSAPELSPFQNNILEFDYIYTGKNIDILEFDMKFNAGLQYLQTATVANTFKGQLERSPNRVMQPSTRDVNSANLGKVLQKPVFFGSQIKSPVMTNTQNAAHTIQSAYSLTQHSSFEVLDVSVRITGNAELLGSINKTTSPGYVQSSTDLASQPTLPPTVAGFGYWTHSPAYVKINIMMPRNNDDFSLFTGTSTSSRGSSTSESQDYARQFWFDGYYYVAGVEHTFENGEFTQNLSLIGLPKASSLETSANASAAQENLDTSIGKCFDNQIGDTAPSQPTSPTVPHTPPAGNTTPTNRADAKTVNQSANGDPSQVIGWDSASPDVQQAIRDASARYGVDVVTMAQFAAQESSFNPNAKAPTSSATGLYQFLTSTWQQLVKQGKVYGVTTVNPDTRTNPRDNANGGAAFLRDNATYIGSTDPGDLYLAHFLGPGAAALIISADDTTGGKELVTAALGAKTAAKIAKANPSIVNPGTTVGELRTWAATTMAAKLKNGTSTARQKTAKPRAAAAPAAAAGAPAGSSQPSNDPENAKRTAGTALAAQQNATAQAAKSDTNPCNDGPAKTQDTSDTAAGVVNSPFPDDPNQIQAAYQIN